ncbi:MAG: hypothetical protein IJO93_00125 [Clostridia bacterium]|nr:hypothetical protein [Clostridia bacterium]
MRTSDKILLVLLALLNFAASVITILAEFVKVSIPYFDGILTFNLRNDSLETLCAVFFIVLTLIVGTSLLIIVSRASKYRLINRNDTVLLNTHEPGTSEITFEALRMMAKKKCMSFRFVEDCTADVEKSGNDISMYIRIRPQADTALLNAADELKRELCASIEGQTGIVLKQVKVIILPYKAKKNA